MVKEYKKHRREAWGSKYIANDFKTVGGEVVHGEGRVNLGTVSVGIQRVPCPCQDLLQLLQTVGALRTSAPERSVCKKMNADLEKPPTRFAPPHPPHPTPNPIIPSPSPAPPRLLPPDTSKNQ